MLFSKKSFPEPKIPNSFAVEENSSSDGASQGNETKHKRGGFAFPSNRKLEAPANSRDPAQYYPSHNSLMDH